LWHILLSYSVNQLPANIAHRDVPLFQIHADMKHPTMTENPISPINEEEHKEFMRRAIELGAKGGLQERSGGKAFKFGVQLLILRFKPHS